MNKKTITLTDARAANPPFQIEPGAYIVGPDRRADPKSRLSEAYQEDQRERNRRAGAAMAAAETIKPPRNIMVEEWQRKADQTRQPVNILRGDFLRPDPVVMQNAEDALMEAVRTGTGYWTGWAPTPGTWPPVVPRICICCGAPADQVQHD